MHYVHLMQLIFHFFLSSRPTKSIFNQKPFCCFLYQWKRYLLDSNATWTSLRQFNLFRLPQSKWGKLILFFLVVHFPCAVSSTRCDFQPFHFVFLLVFSTFWFHSDGNPKAIKMKYFLSFEMVSISLFRNWIFPFSFFFFPGHSKKTCKRIRFECVCAIFCCSSLTTWMRKCHKFPDTTFNSIHLNTLFGLSFICLLLFFFCVRFFRLINKTIIKRIKSK